MKRAKKKKEYFPGCFSFVFLHFKPVYPASSKTKKAGNLGGKIQESFPPSSVVGCEFSPRGRVWRDSMFEIIIPNQQTFVFVKN